MHSRTAAWIACACLGLLLSAPVAHAADEQKKPDAAPDDKKPSITFNLLSVEGLVIGKTLTIDKAFGDQHGLKVPKPFSFVVPLSQDKTYDTFVEPAPKPGEAYIKLNFATPDRQLIENIQFVNMTVPMGETQERLKLAAKTLGDRGLAMVMAGKANPGRDLVRTIKIGDYDAVEVIGHYEEANLGKMYTRLVGILNPDGMDSVAAISNIVLSRVPVETIDDFAKTRSGALLLNFKYLAP